MYGKLDDYRDFHLLSAAFITVNECEYAVVSFAREPDWNARQMIEATNQTYYAAASTMNRSIGTGVVSLPEFYSFLAEAVSKLGKEDWAGDKPNPENEYVTYSFNGFNIIYETRIIPKAQWIEIIDFWTKERERKRRQQAEQS